MDPVTHGLSDVLLSRIGFYQKWGRAATITLVVATLLPDIDHITLRFAGPIAYLKYHRGFTYSVIGIIPLAVLLAFIILILFKNVKTKIGYLNLVGMGILGICTHISLDLITSYGTQIFFPFDTYRYSLDPVFIIDPYFSLIFLLPPVLWMFRRDRAKTIAVTAIVLAIGYLAMTYALKGDAIRMGEKEAVKFSLNASRIDAVPMPLSPFKWSVFIEDEKRFYQVNVDIVRDKTYTEIQR